MSVKEIMLTNKWPFPIDVFIQDSCNEFVTNEIHFHDCFEIIYFLDGQALQIINGTECIVKKNDLILITPNTSHALNYISSTSAKNITIKFLPELLNTVPNMTKSKYIFPFLNNQKSTIIHFDMKNTTHLLIRKLFIDIHQEYLGAKTGFELSILGILLQFLALIFRLEILNPIEKILRSETNAAVIDAFCQYIEKNHSNDITLQIAAKDLHYSYAYLSRILKKRTGKTFSEYLNYVRICEFEKLSISKSDTISDIAYNVGFNNIATFNKVYKKIRGYTPTEFLKQKEREVVTKNTDI